MVSRKFKNIKLKKLKTFYSKDGNVIRVFRSKEMNKIKETYFSVINFNKVKAWKFHEKMCSIHEVNLTLEFKDHYLIQPSINFYDKDEIDYSKNNLNEVGKLVQEGFEYRSDNNKHFLSREEIIKLNTEL